MGVYLRWAAWHQHRWITFAATIAFFMGSLALIPLLPTGFIPPDDNSQTQVYLELPLAPRWPKPGAWPRTRQRVAAVAHVKSVNTTIGGGSAGSPTVSRAAAMPKRARPR